MVPSESATYKWCMVCITNSLNKQDGFRGETRYALMERNCALFYLIIVFREGRQARFELLTTQWNLLAFQCNVDCIPLSACLRHAKKDIINAWIVLDRLSWASTTRVLGTFGKFPRKFLYKRVWNFTKEEILLPLFPNLENIWKWTIFRSLRRFLLTDFISNHNNIFQLLLFIT